MLAETVTQWTQQWLEEGRKKGLQKAAVVLAQRDFFVAEIAQALELAELEARRMLA